MFTLIMVWCGNALQAVIVYRAFRARLLRTYPFFYAYVISTMLSFFLLSFVYLAHIGSYSGMYAKFYWPIQFATLILGCGIVWEVLNHVLAPYPGAEKFARVSGIVAFGIVFCLTLIVVLAAPGRSAAGSLVDLEKSLRTVQAVILFGVLAAISYYRIPVGRNLRGMMLGYGVYVGTVLADFAIWAYAGPRLQSVWAFAPPLSYLLSLAIWLTALWSYCPNPAPESNVRVEEDYELLASRTRKALQLARSQLTRTVRP